MPLKVITPASTFPVDLALARTHLRLTPYGTPSVHPDDDYIEDVLIPSACSYVENYIDRALATQTVELALNEFTDNIYLPGGDVQSVTSVTYLLSGVATTIDTTVYGLNDYAKAPYLYLKLNQVWPTPDAVDSCIKIRYVIGFTTVPVDIISAILLVIGHLYENRQQNITMSINELPLGVHHLLQPYNINVGV